jgi:hypothetical protein
MATPRSTIRALGTDPTFDAHDPDTEPPASRAEPVSPSEAQRRQIWELAPSPATLATIAGGVLAVLLGGALGFWLGRRTAPRPARPVRHFAATVESAAELAPVALNLLKNPLIRAMAVRMIVRQLNKRIAS